MEHGWEKQDFESLNNGAGRGVGSKESQVESAHVSSEEKGKDESDEDTKNKI